MIKYENDGEKTGPDDAEMRDAWDEQMYACEHCDEVFPGLDEMINHQTTHGETNEIITN